jgi:hypothetical protein
MNNTIPGQSVNQPPELLKIPHQPPGSLCAENNEKFRYFYSDPASLYKYLEVVVRTFPKGSKVKGLST